MKNIVTFAQNETCFNAQLQMDTNEHKTTLPCGYTHEQMEASLQTAEADYQNGRCVNHSSICERYGV